MNSYKHSHISGVLLSLNDNGSDYFFLAHTVRNVCEWIASQATLPNNLELPCHLPLPIPAFNVDNPLQLNTTTGKYFQPNRNPILYIEKHRNKSSRCIEARNKVSSTTIFSPPLMEQIVHGTEVQTYRVDAVGMVFMSLSDGAPLYLQVWVLPFLRWTRFILNAGRIFIQLLLRISFRYRYL